MRSGFPYHDLLTMNNSHFPIVLSALFLAVLTSCQTDIKEDPADQPNIIFILADDLGWADVGFNGAQYYETPNMDLLASKGIRFTQAYANAANCAPTRASIMSGQYTSRHGVVTVGESNRGDRKAQQLIPVVNTEHLDTTTLSLAEMLKPAGYHSAFIGKWHLGNHQETSPLAHGFDYSLAGWEKGSPKSYFSPYFNPALEDGPDGEQLTGRLTDEAIRYIQQQQETAGPFFLYLSYYAVHAPLQAKDSLIQKYTHKPPTVQGRDNPVYAGMIETLDDNLGKLYQFLEQNELFSNTIIVFWSDNGGSFRATVNTPLKGSKGMPHEGGIRVPAFVYAPRYYPESKVIETPVISTDLYPTFAAWAGAEWPDHYPVDGADLHALLQTGEMEDRAIFWYAPVYLGGSGNYAFRMTPSAIIRKGAFKLIWDYSNDKTVLYNINTDLSESNDLSQELPEITVQLLQELKSWHQATNAAVPAQPNPQYDSLYTAKQYEMVRYE